MQMSTVSKQFSVISVPQTDSGLQPLKSKALHGDHGGVNIGGGQIVESG